MSDTTSVYSATRLPVVDAEPGFSLAIRLYTNHEQIVDFKLPGVAVLGLDERPPTGKGWGPSPAHLVGAALGACLANRLLSWLREQGIEVDDMRTDVTASFAHDADGQQRLGRVTVRLSPIIQSARPAAMLAPAALLRRSVIARSLRRDVDVQVTITPEAPSPRAARPNDLSAGVPTTVIPAAGPSRATISAR
jgi:uncharacterized OsmC-like protein